MTPAIVIPCFQRPRALARLLSTIAEAEHPDGTRLIISVEGDSHPEVVRIAQGFEAKNLNVEVVLRTRRLGLREHVLSCGDISLKEGSVIILEDDLVVDRYYYQYATAALRHYADSDAVGGVALYAPEYNEYARLPFRPVRNGHCTYLMQVPCSSGQVWSARQWSGFRNWYAAPSRSAAVNAIRGLPDQVKGWPASSWKRYFAGYLVETGKAFVYPYESLSSNCGDAGGTHDARGTHLVQVALGDQGRDLPHFSFCPLDTPRVAYDAYMEASGSHIFDLLGLADTEVSIDLYGLKPLEELRSRPYVLTSRPVQRAEVEYPLSYRPIEQNLAFPAVPGGGALFLARSVDVEQHRSAGPALDALSYHAGIPLATRGPITAALRAFPRVALEAATRRLRRQPTRVAPAGGTSAAADTTSRPSDA